MHYILFIIKGNKSLSQFKATDYYCKKTDKNKLLVKCKRIPLRYHDNIVLLMKSNCRCTYTKVKCYQVEN